MKKNASGFTLIELMITLIIMAVLIKIAYPTYANFIRKSRRTDATTSLLAVQLAEEKYRYNNNSYGNLTQVWSGATTTPGGYYTLAVTGNNATGYTITATATGTQANDKENGTSCSPMVLSVSNGVVTQTPAVCWK